MAFQHIPTKLDSSALRAAAALPTPPPTPLFASQKSGIKLYLRRDQNGEMRFVPPPVPTEKQPSGIKLYLRRGQDGQMRFVPPPAATYAPNNATTALPSQDLISGPSQRRTGIKIYLRRGEDNQWRFVNRLSTDSNSTPKSQRSGVKLYLRRGQDNNWRFVSPQSFRTQRSGIKIYLRRDKHGQLRFVPPPERLVRCCQNSRARGCPPSHRYNLRSRAVRDARRRQAIA